jgi:hypothetical protein
MKLDLLTWGIILFSTYVVIAFTGWWSNRRDKIKRGKEDDLRKERLQKNLIKLSEKSRRRKRKSKT